VIVAISLVLQWESAAVGLIDLLHQGDENNPYCCGFRSG
jgi:hypothetical protein